METRVVTAHIPIDLARRMDEIALRMERPKGWIIKQALTNWLELEVRRHQLTLDALRSVDEGRVVENNVIESWIKSLDKRV